MSQKENEKQEWSDPKDFGLTYVDLNQSVSEAVSTFSENPPPVVSIAEPVVNNFKEEEAATTANEAEKKNPVVPQKGKVKQKKRIAYWVWMVLILVVCLFGVIYWQIGLENRKMFDSRLIDVSTSTSIPEEEKQSSVSELKTQEVIQSEQNKDSIKNQSEPTDIELKSTETGTTIAPKESNGNLIRIETKESKVQYFVVVASVRSEKLALELIEKFEGKSPEFYLITPYESSENFRIATSKFDSWKAASEEKTRIKPQFSEDLWILNY